MNTHDVCVECPAKNVFAKLTKEHGKPVVCGIDPQKCGLLKEAKNA